MMRQPMTDIDVVEAVVMVCGLKTKRVSDLSGRPFYLLVGKDRVYGSINSRKYDCDALVRFKVDGSFMEVEKIYDAEEVR